MQVPYGTTQIRFGRSKIKKKLISFVKIKKTLISFVKIKDDIV
jgi:hypothetical protein